MKDDKMLKIRLKPKFALIATLLVLVLSIVFTGIPAITAQTISRLNPYPFIGAIPNPVGVNQEVLLHLGSIYPIAHPQPGWYDLTVEVITPDGQTEILGPFTTDTTGGTGAVYVPSMVGTYRLKTHFPEQASEVDSPEVGPAGTIMEEATSDELELIVQQDPIVYYPGSSLPREYWTRPINSQNREWSTISGNWLEAWPYIPWDPTMRNAPYNDAPETGHILWTQPLLAMGGLVGGELGDHSFEDGDAYEGKWLPPIIVGGVLYYNQFEARGGDNVEQTVVAKNLRTGEELWTKPLIDSNGGVDRLEFGQLFYWDSYNYHGVFGYLWTTTGSTWNAFDASTGRWVYSMENVPSGERVRGPKGEIYIYSVNQDDQKMTLWNSSKVVTANAGGGSAPGSWRPHGFVYDALDGIEWTVPIDQNLPNGGGGGVRAVFFEDRIVLSSDNRWSQEPVNYLHLAAINVKPGHEGETIFNTTWTPENPPTQAVVRIASLDDGVIILGIKETMSLVGLSLDTGAQIWGPTDSMHYLDAYSILNDRRSINHISEGRYFVGGMAGIVYTFNIKTGDLLWETPIVDQSSEILWSNNWPLYGTFVSDGKLYVHHAEHSVVDPKPRGAPFTCLDVETGEIIWSINIRGHHWGGYPIIGDSTIAIYSTYDQRIYAIGKGPSSTTLAVPDEAVNVGSSAPIRGNVMDISPGTNTIEINTRFPNGVPAVSDLTISDWMMYVYSQSPMPDNLEGVPVKIDVIDPNGEYTWIGTPKTDVTGNYAYSFKPTIEGQYTVISTFEGSNSYYGSTAIAYITVDPAISSSAVIPQESQESPLITLELAIIVVVVIASLLGLVAYWMLKRK